MFFNKNFADQVNGALFQGRQVVKPEEFMPADAQAVYLGKEAGARKNYKAVADKVRLWRGRLIHILAVENQTFVDYHMVVWYGKDKATLKKVLEENRNIYSRIDSETRELIGIVGKVQLGEEYSILKNGERKYDICKAFMDMELEGIQEGIEQGEDKRSRLIEKLVENNRPQDIIKPTQDKQYRKKLYEENFISK